MGKGKNRKEVAAATTSSVGGASNQRNALAAKNEASIIDQLRPGRHPCKCQARKHELILNCLGCGKIVCKQEGSGPCFYCGTLVCTPDEKEILERGSKKSAELYEKLMGVAYNGERGLSLFALGRDLEKATEFRNKLLAADADSERRNRVNDLEADYSSVDKDPFLTADERKRIRKRIEELKMIREQRRKQLVVNLDLTSLSVSEQKPNLQTNQYDPVIQEILNKSEQRRKAMNAIAETAVDARWIPKGFVPKYPKDIGTTFASNVNEYTDADALVLMNEEMAILEVERRGYAIAMDQPSATLIANGKIKYFRWPEDIQLKGPVFVASFGKSVSVDEIQNAIKMYCKDSSALGLDFSPGSLHGRVFIVDCLTIKEFEQEKGNHKVAGKGNHVLVFEACEPLRIPIPFLPPKDHFQLDKEMRRAMADVFKC